MKRKHIRIFLLITITCIVFTGYLKGCTNSEISGEYPPPVKKRDSASLNINFRDGFITVAAGPHYKKTKAHDLVYGSHYRDLWALPVKMKVFDLDKEMGGLKILKRGGHMQTLSIHLVNKEGKKYVLRTIDKDQSMALPPFWKNKMLTYLIRDQTSAINPYGSLIIPELSKAAGIASTHPELFFIPYDTRLGEYAKLLEGKIAILEEFPDKSWLHSDKFENAEDIINTSDMLYQRYQFQEVSIDGKAFARARLFDLFINDWDRHKEQWKWGLHTQGNKKTYKPIPRDRDMAFYKFDSGILPAIIKSINHKFQTFDKKYGDIKGMVKNSQYVDGLILNNFSEEEFLAIADSLQKNLTDEVIEQAVRAWPEEVYNMAGAKTIRNLKSRRDSLYLAAKEFYRLVYKHIKLVGTDMEEKFIVERLNNDETSVSIENEKGEIIYKQIFNHNITQEISLYGLRGSDKFILSGKTDKGILINIYGGEDYDKIKDESFVNGYIKKTRIFDLINSNEITPGKETEDNSTDDPSILYFDRTGAKRTW